MPEIITTPNALVQTTNGKRFYVNSGIVSVDNTETAVIDIPNIGERDIRLNVNTLLGGPATDDMAMKLKINGLIIYSGVFNNIQSESIHYALPFIIPANSSLIITFQNVTDTSSQNVGVSCYGRYLSM